ncbi:hypothetical protein [Pseudoxanthomonas sp. PXM02]|uniref:hypothetical protein n=1 Tax=Pseudoxanthomonas sp. PXM02 TaxID=2769294 RepID=UPI0017876EAA|nr:hypothetical protein [Pseudoxanthomonas sp. PXM02]MBD9480281.1 hypothetical protein [Pseudoxanthomonas sp. PXM02]
MKAWMWAICLLATTQGVAAQSATPVDSHDAHHQQPPAAASLGKTGPALREKRKQGVSPAYARQWRDAMALGDQDDVAAADRALAQVMAHREFATLSEDEQRATWSRAAWMAVRLGDHDRARRWATRAIDAGSDDPDNVYLLAQLDARDGAHGAAATRLRDLAVRWPHVLAHLDTGFVMQTARQAPEGTPIRLQVLEALLQANWDANGLGAGDLWYQLALLYQARGDAEGVRRAVALTTSPEALVKFRVDRRFDALLDRNEAAFDIAAAAKRRMEHLRALAAERPRNLEVRMELGSALLAVGQHADVVTLATTTLGAVSAAPTETPAFDDPDYEVWIINARAIAQRRLGRLYDAQADLFRGTLMSESGDLNVSQALNLGQFLCQRGRPDEALAAIDNVGQMSGYGRMVQASIEHCAAVQRQDAAAAKRALAYLGEHREDSLEIWIWALVEANRMDDAAAGLIAALAAPATRGDLLAAVQEYREPAPLPAFEPVQARWRALLARDDVRKAVADVGRIERQPIFASSGI